MRSIKQYEIERNLLIQTCDVLDRTKLYLTDCLLEMKDKQKSYCRYLSTAEVSYTKIKCIFSFVYLDLLFLFREQGSHQNQCMTGI